ncbi:MAG: hypothetical protein PWQ55_1876 [Chloroflexota bacterium]|nr:hypothetical protein [Chloroflexota bacterium]
MKTKPFIFFISLCFLFSSFELKSAAIGESAPGNESDGNAFGQQQLKVASTPENRPSPSLITNITWNDNNHYIEVKVEPWPDDFSPTKILVDGQEIPTGDAPGRIMIRPNAELDQSPDGFIIGTLPWVTGLDDIAFPCLGSLQLGFPDGSVTNAYAYDLIEQGCKTGAGKAAQHPQDPTSGQTTSGRIAKDTRWSGDILITGDVYVPEGVTLTIDPGTVVRFKHYRGYKEPEKRLGITVDGTIIAEGSPDQPIYFTSGADDPQNGDWRMIRVSNSDESIFSYVVVEFGQQGLNFWSGKPKVQNSVVRWNNWEGIYFESYAQGEVSNTHVYQNGYNGIAAEQYNDLVIDHCLIEESGTSGIHLDATNAVITSSIFLNNGAGGVSVDNGASVILKGVLSSQNGEGVATGEGNNIIQVGNVQITGNRNCQICGDSEEIEDDTPIPEEITFDFSPDMSYALGYTPGDKGLDKYAYVYDAEDETRAVVKKVGENLGLTWAVAWDGEALWTASLWAEYYRIDPNSGEILTHFQGPGSQIWGLTFDGKHLWALDFAERMIYEIDPANGQTLSSFPSPDPDNGCKGLTWDGEYLYVAGWASNFVYVMDRSGDLVGTIERNDWGNGGLAWDGEYFWSPGGPGIVKTTKDGRNVGWIYAASEGTWDMAWGDGLLWASQRTNENWSDAKIYAIEIRELQGY